MPNRRTFLKAGIPATAPLLAQSSQPAPTDETRRVFLTGDGVNLTPAEYAQLLARITASGSKPDSYLKGGAVEELENRLAKMLGKERGLFLPTGTLANHLGVRLLAGSRKRVLVQEESHLYRDESDCAQALSGLNLVPLASGRATFTAREIADAVDRSGMPPYPVPVGAISIESPVRRMNGQAFDFGEMKKISAFAREKKIGLHLDGARMFLASAYTGIAPVAYSALFDTVYVSLYKYFNAPFGAVLTGPAALIEEASYLRRQFGGALAHGREPAAVALHYLDGFEDRHPEWRHSLHNQDGSHEHPLSGGVQGEKDHREAAQDHANLAESISSALLFEVQVHRQSLFSSASNRDSDESIIVRPPQSR